MMLLVDLDNTLVDRATAFGHWTTGFIRQLGRPDSDAVWLVGADRDGYEPRDSLARTMKERLNLDVAVEDLVDRLLYEHVELMTIEPGVPQALAAVRELGWKIAIVTNGATSQQILKIQKLGLESFVDAVVISEAEGVKKPDPEIFRIAARRLGLGPGCGWMIGDHARADIAGGRAAGLETGWVSRGMTWPEGEPAPTVTAATAAEVIDTVVLQYPCRRTLH